MVVVDIPDLSGRTCWRWGWYRCSCTSDSHLGCQTTRTLLQRLLLNSSSMVLCTYNRMQAAAQRRRTLSRQGRHCMLLQRTRLSAGSAQTQFWYQGWQQCRRSIGFHLPRQPQGEGSANCRKLRRTIRARAVQWGAMVCTLATLALSPTASNLYSCSTHANGVWPPYCMMVWCSKGC